MGVKRLTKTFLNHILRRYGAEIVSTNILYEWQHGPVVNMPSFNNCTLPDDAARYLKPNNPKLIELQQRYKAFDLDVTTPFVWTDRHVRPEDITYFRGTMRGSGR
jgi:hypothetical protein